MAKKQGSSNGGSRRWGPNGAADPTRKQITDLIMGTYPDPRSGLRFDSIADRIGALYATGAVKAHVAGGALAARASKKHEFFVGRGRKEIAFEYHECMKAIPDMNIDRSSPRFLKDGTIEVDWVLTGTHLGAFRGVRPSGKRVRITGTERFTIKGMQIQRHVISSNYDELGWNGIIVGAPRPTNPLFPKHPNRKP